MGRHESWELSTAVVPFWWYYLLQPSPILPQASLSSCPLPPLLPCASCLFPWVGMHSEAQCPHSTLIPATIKLISWIPEAVRKNHAHTLSSPYLLITCLFAASPYFATGTFRFPLDLLKKIIFLWAQDLRVQIRMQICQTQGPSLHRSQITDVTSGKHASSVMQLIQQCLLQDVYLFFTISYMNFK